MLVDEAWLFNETPSIMDLLENIARRGRKRGLVLLYISQRPQDIASSPQGRALLEQSATTILMRQERTAWDVMRSIYRLDDTEIEGLVNAETGGGYSQGWEAQASDEDLRIAGGARGILNKTRSSYIATQQRHYNAMTLRNYISILGYRLSVGIWDTRLGIR